MAYKNIGHMLQKSLEHFWSSFLVKFFKQTLNILLFYL